MRQTEKGHTELYLHQNISIGQRLRQKYYGQSNIKISPIQDNELPFLREKSAAHWCSEYQAKTQTRKVNDVIM
jgi:hypothetical protein